MSYAVSIITTICILFHCTTPPCACDTHLLTHTLLHCTTICTHSHTYNYFLTGPQLLCCSHSCTFYVSLCYDAHKILHTHCLTALYSLSILPHTYYSMLLSFSNLHHPRLCCITAYCIKSPTYTDYYATHLLPHGTSLPSATYPTIHCAANTTIVSLPLSHTCICRHVHTHTHIHTHITLTVRL